MAAALTTPPTMPHASMLDVVKKFLGENGLREQDGAYFVDSHKIEVTATAEAITLMSYIKVGDSWHQLVSSRTTIAYDFWAYFGDMCRVVGIHLLPSAIPTFLAANPAAIIEYTPPEPTVFRRRKRLSEETHTSQPTKAKFEGTDGL